LLNRCKRKRGEKSSAAYEGKKEKEKEGTVLVRTSENSGPGMESVAAIAQRKERGKGGAKSPPAVDPRVCQ